MGIFYSVSDKTILEAKNKIFVNKGLSALKVNGFERSPYKGELFGKNNLGDYTYSLCRLDSNSQLECIETHITKGDTWIKIFLNIFQLTPTVKTLEELKGLDGMQFFLPPNSKTRMRLRTDDFEGVPLFRTTEHRLKAFYSESGFHKRIEELGELIESDLNNIDSFIKRWHDLHKPMVTDWEGKKIE
jgi:hypothetical protein